MGIVSSVANGVLTTVCRAVPDRAGRAPYNPAVATPPARHKALFARFVEGPALIRASLDGVTAGALNQRPPGEEWSIRDLVIAATDAELLLAVRVRLMLTGDADPLPSLDETAARRRLQYLWRDVDAAMALLSLTRFTTAELLSHVDAAGWERTGPGEGGAVTIAALVDAATRESEELAARIAAIRSRAN